MSQPTASSVHVDAALTNISIAYIQSQDQFIAGKVFPTIPVAKASDKYFVYTKNDWFRDEAALRAPATESAGSGYNLSTASYSCDVWAIHKDIPDQVMANADAPIDVEADAARFVAQRMLLRQEIDWMSTFFASSVWANDVTPSNLWSSYSNSTPIADIETGRKTILSNTGLQANTLILGYDVFSALLNHPEFVDRIKYTSSGAVTTELMASLFRVDNVYVASAVKATNVEGETAAYSFASGKHALLCHVAPSPGVLTPSAGYTFAWQGVSDGLGANIGTVRIDLPTRRATRIESQAAWDNKVVATDLGYFFASVVS